MFQITAEIKSYQQAGLAWVPPT